MYILIGGKTVEFVYVRTYERISSKLTALRDACSMPTCLVYEGYLGIANRSQQAATVIQVVLVQKENDLEELDNPPEDDNWNDQPGRSCLVHLFSNWK